MVDLDSEVGDEGMDHRASNKGYKMREYNGNINERVESR